MPKLPTIENENPINESTKFSNATANASDEFARYLGKFSQDSLSMAKQQFEIESKTNSVMSQNQMTQALQQSHMDLIKHPDQAQSIAKHTSETIEDINKNAYVNKADRAHLSQVAVNYKYDNEINAVKTSHAQAKLSSEFQYYRQLPQVTQSINQLYQSGKPEEAHATADQFLKATEGGVRSGMLPISAYETAAKAVSSTEFLAHSRLEAIKFADADAKTFQKLNLSPFGKINQDISNDPINHYTNHSLSHFDSATSETILTDQIKRYGEITTPHLLNNLDKPETIAKVEELYFGARDARAAIQANVPDFQIRSDYQYLEFKKNNGELTQREEGRYAFQKSYYANLERDYEGTMLGTVVGSAIQKDYLAKKALLDEQLQSTPQGSPGYLSLAQDINSNEDMYHVNLHNLGVSQHINPALITSIPQEKLAVVKAGFISGQNPNLIINTLHATTPALRPYFADSLKDPVQKAVANIVSSSGDQVKQGFNEELILANQTTGKDYEKLGKYFDISSASSRIHKAIYANSALSDTISYLGNKPQGNEHIAGTLDAITNMVMDLALKNGDKDFAKINNYMSYISENLRNAYDIHTDSNSVINKKDFPSLGDNDLKVLSHYAANQSLIHAKNELSTPELRNFVDNKNFVLVGQPNGFLTIINPTTKQKIMRNDGVTPLFEEKFTDSLLSHARAESKKGNDDLNVFTLNNFNRGLKENPLLVQSMYK